MGAGRTINSGARRAGKLCLLILAGAFSLAPGSTLCSSPYSSRRGAPGEDHCLTCHSTAAGRAGEVVRIHRNSTHGRAGVGCADCHGGDPEQTEKARAHAVNFTARPDANGTLAMCGRCHQTPLTQFKSSRHFQARAGLPRLDCAECHGAHGVGNPPESFTYAQFCAGCHGLEYLPELPPSFQALLTTVDEVRDAFVMLAARGRRPAAELVASRKELRRLTAEIVHPTDLAGGLKRIPQILPKGESLMQQIKSSR